MQLLFFSNVAKKLTGFLVDQLDREDLSYQTRNRRQVHPLDQVCRLDQVDQGDQGDRLGRGCRVVQPALVLRAGPLVQRGPADQGDPRVLCPQFDEELVAQEVRMSTSSHLRRRHAVLAHHPRRVLLKQNNSWSQDPTLKTAIHVPGIPFSPGGPGGPGGHGLPAT